MALSADRITRAKSGGEVAYPVYQSTTIYLGGLVAINSSGYAISATTTAGLRVVGVAEEYVDNSSGSDGDLWVRVARRKSFEMENSSSNAVDQDDVGHICYVEDDETVCDVNAGSPVVAGVIDQIDPVTSKVWVYIAGDVGADTGADDVSGIETVTSGALSLYTRTSLLSISGTQAFTLANGLYEGQRKTVVVSAAASTPAGTLTPATYANGTDEHLSAVGEYLELEYHDSGGWRLIDFRLSQRSDETVTTGALSLFTKVSKLDITGTQAFTLADGLYTGQEKFVVVTATASTPAGTLTPANYSDGTSEFFSAIGEMLHLVWDGTNWKKVSFRLGVAGAETVTSGALSLYTLISFISVTGTQAYTLADGLYPGQMKFCRCTVAASTPDGTLTPNSASGFSTADFDATEEAYCFIWNGTAWECAYVIDGAVS